MKDEINVTSGVENTNVECSAFFDTTNITILLILLITFILLIILLVILLLFKGMSAINAIDITTTASSSIWNSIPNDVRCAPSLSSFKSRLKTYLFRSVYKD